LRFIILFFFSIFLTSAECKSFDINSTEIIKLDDYTLFYNNETNLDFDNNNLENISWNESANGGSFGLIRSELWMKFDFNNKSDDNVEKYIYIPFFLTSKIDVYYKNKKQLKHINELGFLRNNLNNDKKSKGWITKIKFDQGQSSIYLKINNKNRPTRVNVFVLNELQLENVVIQSYKLYWFWKGVFVFAILVSLIIFIFIKQRIFIYYFFFNLGIFITLNIEFGDYSALIKNDLLYRMIDIQRITNLLYIVFFPLFLNELIPIKKMFFKTWRMLQIANVIFIVLWIINLFEIVRLSDFYFYSTLYYLGYAVFVLLTMLIILFWALIKKEQNSYALFIIYFIFISFTIFDGYAQTFGIVKDDIFVYKTILLSSMFQIVAFLLLISYKIYKIYLDRNVLIRKQNKHDNELIKAIVEGQETERNVVGRELHDMIGANLAVIKQKTDKSNLVVVRLIDDTIDGIRALSHGLITPNIKFNNFEEEIQDLCLLFETKDLKIKYYFHNCSSINNIDVSNHLYRIIQELLQNALKHSHANEVYIQFLKDKDILTVMYEDNGVGFDLHKNTNGRGIQNIKNRIALIGAEIQFESTTDGTLITMIIDEL